MALLPGSCSTKGPEPGERMVDVGTHRLHAEAVDLVVDSILSIVEAVRATP